MDKLPIHIGPSTYIDGGPFFNCTAVDFRDGEVKLRDENDNEHWERVGDIEDALAEEIEADEPIRIGGIHRDAALETIKLPLREGFLVDVHGGGAWAVGGELWLSQKDEVLRLAKEKGANYEPNN